MMVWNFEPPSAHIRKYYHKFWLIAVTLHMLSQILPDHGHAVILVHAGTEGLSLSGRVAAVYGSNSNLTLEYSPSRLPMVWWQATN